MAETLPPLPDYLSDQTEEAILERVLDRLPADWDRSEGSVVRTILTPPALELAQGAIWAQETLRRAFATTAYGEYLDHAAAERGIYRRPATYATVVLRFSGNPGTVIPAGTQVATPTTGTEAPVVYRTTQAATIPASGQVDVPATAVEAGSGSRVAADTLTLLVAPVPGVTGVTNPAASTGGEDEEDDESLRRRLLDALKSPGAAGARADYVRWALEVTGVGGAVCVPVEDGPGTVSVYIIGTDKRPADQRLIDQVQEHIAPPWNLPAEAETLALSGSGVWVVEDAEASAGQAVLLTADGDSLTQQALHELLEQPGLWQVRVRLRVEDVTGTGDLLRIGVWNLSTGDWAKADAAGTADAVRTIRPADLSTLYGDALLEYWWNGIDQLELRVLRLPGETTPVYVDRVTHRSTFSRRDGEGRAPVGARVTVKPAVAVPISVAATITVQPGYAGSAVLQDVRTALEEYLKGLAFAKDNDVRYAHVGQVILSTPGVADYQGLLINGGTENVAVAQHEVAVLGEVSLNLA